MYIKKESMKKELIFLLKRNSEEYLKKLLSYAMALEKGMKGVKAWREKRKNPVSPTAWILKRWKICRDWRMSSRSLTNRSLPISLGQYRQSGF